jgi:hypothetical protein
MMLPHVTACEETTIITEIGAFGLPTNQDELQNISADRHSKPATRRPSPARVRFGSKCEELA